LISALKEKGKFLDSDVRPLLENIIKKELGDSKPGSSPKNSRKIEFMNQLLIMGYSEQQAKEALSATNYSSIEQAIDYLNKT
jgi:Holliday junction resolvasome RuvABC DNA-binding subunit